MYALAGTPVAEAAFVVERLYPGEPNENPFYTK